MFTQKNRVHEFYQDDTISLFNGKPQKLVDQCINLGGNISSTESDLIIRLGLHHHHHHHVVLVARISLTLSRHFSLSFIASGRSSGQHPVFSHSCWIYVRAGRPAFARPCVGVHKSTSLMSSSLLLQQCPACLVRLTWIWNSNFSDKIKREFLQVVAVSVLMYSCIIVASITSWIYTWKKFVF